MNWIYLAEDGESWLAVLNTIMNLEKGRKFLDLLSDSELLKKVFTPRISFS